MATHRSSQVSVLRPAPRSAGRPTSPDGGETSRAGGGIRAAALLLALVLLVGAGLTQLRTPPVAGTDAPAAEFSGERAMQRLRAFATEPRPLGSDASAAGVDYLVGQLRDMGYDPQTWEAQAVNRFPGGDDFSAASVRNVAVRIPGTDSTGTVLLDAHHDSGRTGPGAADCGSCVVTVLETLRALSVSPPLRNDLVAVFTDGEEDGDLGAAAFANQHPWASDVRVALNFEAQGSGGPAVLYWTSDDAGWLTSQLLDVMPNPSAYALLPRLLGPFEAMQPGTDAAEYAETGSDAVTFLFMGDTPAYHTQRDNVEVIDPGSIQQEGGYALAAARRFGALDLTAAAPQAEPTFFNVAPGLVIAYPEPVAVALTALAVVALLALVVAGLRRHRLTGWGMLRGGGTFVAGVVLATAVAGAGWWGVRWLQPAYQAPMIGNGQTWQLVAAFSLLALGIVTGMLLLASRRRSVADVAAGAALVWAGLLVAVTLTQPGAAYVLAWPLLFALVPLALRVLAPAVRVDGWPWVAVLAVAAIPALVGLPATFYVTVWILNRLEGLGGVPLLGLAALVPAMLGGLLVWHAAALTPHGRRWTVPALAAVLAVAIVGWSAATYRFSPEFPRPDAIAYELDASSGTARWISPDPQLDAYTSQFFPAAAVRGPDGFTADAPAVDLPPPGIDVTGVTESDGVRTVRLRVTSPRDASAVAIDLAAPGPLLAVRLGAAPLDLDGYRPAADGRLALRYSGLPASGLDLTVRYASLGRLEVRATDQSDGLPDVPGFDLPTRPADTMPRPGGLNDGTTVRTQRVV